MRLLKDHERRLLRKVDFLRWKRERTVRELKVMKRYLLSDREDYVKYNKLVGYATKLVAKLKELPADDPVRINTTKQLLDKLYALGVIPTKSSLLKVDKLSVSALCRRRLPTVLVKLKMAEQMKEAVGLVEGGHVRVGPEVVTDPAFLVPRSMEDFVTWVDSSRIRRAVAKYNDKLDDFELLGN